MRGFIAGLYLMVGLGAAGQTFADGQTMGLTKDQAGVAGLISMVLWPIILGGAVAKMSSDASPQQPGQGK